VALSGDRCMRVSRDPKIDKMQERLDEVEEEIEEAEEEFGKIDPQRPKETFVAGEKPEKSEKPEKPTKP
jgi:uncharacterized membrane protein YukC